MALKIVDKEEHSCRPLWGVSLKRVFAECRIYNYDILIKTVKYMSPMQRQLCCTVLRVYTGLSRLDGASCESFRPSPPAALEALPGAIETRPGDLEALSGAFEALPGALETLPGALETLPGALETLPGALETLPGYGDLTELLCTADEQLEQLE